MRKVVRTIKDIRVCEEDAPLSALPGSQNAVQPLAFTLWSLEGYFLGAFATLQEACDIAESMVGAPFEATTLDGGRLIHFSDPEAPSNSGLVIVRRNGEEVREVADFQAATESIRADMAAAAIGKPPSSLDLS